MIERIYIKNLLKFKEIELNPSENLNVFTGPSGAGKSILLKGIVSIFGLEDAKSEWAEALLDINLDLENYGIEKDEVLIFKQIKKNKVRYFINNQSISKKKLKDISSKFIDYFFQKDIKEFKNEHLIKILDAILIKEEKEYDKKLKEFKNQLQLKNSLAKELSNIEKLEKEAIQRRDYLKYEIEKIKSINPKIGEFEELMSIKKDLSKIEKIKEKAKEVESIFYLEDKVYEFLDMLDESSDFFSNTMNELRVILEKSQEKVEILENTNIEEILDRLSKLQELILKYGSIEESLKVLKEKEKELEEIENLSFKKDELIKKLNNINKNLSDLAEFLHLRREDISKIFLEKLNFFLQKMHMPQAKLLISKTTLNNLGMTKVNIIINGIDLDKISTGEFNRLRLAIIAAQLEYLDEEKIIFLDEIDANLSGEESMSVADVIKYLSSKYQVFAISHQPHLASVANKHFLVSKNGKLKELNDKERIEEIARIVGGKNNSIKAIEYAKELLKSKN